ncbi:MAG: NUDIX hydrolase [Christensenellaceae bacterium]|nr:NUDIX hydrolase [Christensenellaceae bacterium]
MAELFEEMISSEQIYDGKVVKLYKDTVRLPNGSTSVREIVRHPGAVCVVPVTDKGEIIMVRQFRYAFNKVFLEIPAGKLDFPGEDPRAAALRELSEETGAEAASLEYLGLFCSTIAIFDEKIHMYLARGIKMGESHPDEDEFLEIVTMPFHDAVEMVMDGKIEDGKTQAAILKTWTKLR